MKTIFNILENKFRDAFILAGIPNNAPILLTEATKDEFGDYQVNGAMSAAKLLKKNPREIAQLIINNLTYEDIIVKCEIAGPGFINITLSDNYLSQYIAKLSQGNKYGALLPKTEIQTIIIDYSSPNLAKEMHVGHLRSTVIGDALNNILSYIGNTVIAQNHVGDWGTQFGMLIAYMIECGDINNFKHSVGDLEDFYRKAKIRFDEDGAFQVTARQYVVTLQNWQNCGEEGQKIYGYWKTFTNLSLQHCQIVYNKLAIQLNLDNVAPESMYNNQLDKVVKVLADKKLIVDSDGAKCAFFTEGELPGGETTPYIVQKKDGGYLYSTTDLAAIDYRVHTLHGNRLLYVVDARQSFHFNQLFLLAKKAEFAEQNTTMEHVYFGTMMNECGKPFKTREGGTVKLIDLIDEAIIRAKALIKQKNISSNEIDLGKLAKQLAIASIKYADLSKNRTGDYIFGFDKMLSFEGNTAPYLLYAYTRIHSLLKKASHELDDLELILSSNHKIIISHVTEHKLALLLARFADTLLITAKDCYPHYLCQYLYSLSGAFMQFYEVCNIIKEPNRELIISRLILVDKISQILKTGLGLLGISTIEKM